MGTKFLKNLEIVGFKSFADKTYLEFNEGITAIVGPNGSGKSNIVEAFKFVLGERESKNLRGSKSEDLIFAGNEKRGAAGFAEVKITFSNNTKQLPIEYEEIEIKRKITRDGLSDYFLGKSQVRLKDIIELLSKAKLGTRGLGIVNQGEVDNILKASPQERKIMLEEILGLKQYQIKKQEAARQLESAKENIEKIRALIEEILPHLRSLKRQTSRWEKRTEIEENLKNLEFQYFGGRFLEIEKNKNRLLPLILKVKEEINKNELEIKKIEDLIAEQEKNRPEAGEKHLEIENQINLLIEEKNKLLKNLGRIEAIIEDRQKKPASNIIPPAAKKPEVSILISALKNIRTEILELNNSNDLSFVKEKLKEIIKKIDLLFEIPVAKQPPIIKTESQIELESYLKEQKIAENEVSKINAAITELKNKIKTIQEEQEKQNSVFYELVKKAEAIRLIQRSKERELNELKLSEEKEKLKEEDLKEDLKQNNWQYEEFLNKFKNAPTSEENNINELEEKIHKLRRELQIIGEIDPLVIEEAKSTEERYNFLSKQYEDLKKTADDLEKLIQELTEKIAEELNNGILKINEEFSKFFSLMFGKGTAKLYFEKPKEEPFKENQKNEDISAKPKTETEINNEEKIQKRELGIEISINIPRKRVKSIEMLSGGEKALTSIALLFAIVAAAEPPFIILDEIDAALDQRNTKIFTQMLKELSDKTQFILITHNNITMESANILYGVTMGQDGVSKILSLRLANQ